jgi:hypothetical protein
VQFGRLVVVRVIVELRSFVSTVTAEVDDLCGVESLLAHVVQRIVEDTRQLAERLGLEVVIFILLLALLGLVLEPVQPVVNGVLQVSMVYPWPMSMLMLMDPLCSRLGL